MFLTAILHLQFKHDCLETAGYRATTPDDTAVQREEQEKTKIQTSRDATRPSANSHIARFLANRNQPLALFWKVPKHWLATLADYLHRTFNSDVVNILNKRALANFKPT